MESTPEPTINTTKKPQVKENKEKLSLKVLIADDDNNLRSMLKLILEDMGHKVKAVADGQQLLNELNGSESYDLVISDNNMPSGNNIPEKKGIDVLKEIRSVDKLKEIPFIITTTDTGDLKKRVVELGGLYLPKPYKIFDLDEVVKKITEGKV